MQKSNKTKKKNIAVAILEILKTCCVFIFSIAIGILNLIGAIVD